MQLKGRSLSENQKQKNPEYSPEGARIRNKEGNRNIQKKTFETMKT